VKKKAGNNMNSLLFFLLAIVWLKSLLIGSDFSFYYWLKYGGEYTKWYNDIERQVFVVFKGFCDQVPVEFNHG